MSPVVALVVSVLLLAGNAFFVAAEFALVASKRHRLEQAAHAGSGVARRAARAALAGTRELSLMLAGAQLGITLCSLGLGAIAEPALAHLLDPALTTLGLPHQISYAVAFLLGLAVVVFSHMVVGEMAPKSWAISHPERSALLLALPFRAFTRATRPALALLNGIANTALRAIKVEPQAELAAAHGPDDLRMLLEQSHQHGLLAPDQHRLLTRVLHLQRTIVADAMTPWPDAVTVPAHTPAAEIERLARATGHSRYPVTGDHDHPIGVVHVHDALRAHTTGRTATAADLMSPVLFLRPGDTCADAIQTLRAHHAQLALVHHDPRDTGDTGGGSVLGLVTLEDLLEELIGEFDDETDTPTAQPTREHPRP
ncbi:hemolysin family protein [Carbonactinospora thermoautotrophica]|uniref:hemolysin family protein n=1 Tax=Carbonactinospora thermoautotrophica TaxID=1469144 RepID=UPI00082FDCC6|nr:hemolysin family protein [Carbonactinospora thermoautotrophica]